MKSWLSALVVCAGAALTLAGSGGVSLAQTAAEKCDKESGEDAIEACTEVIRQDASAAWAFLSRGNAWKNREHLENAINDFSRAIELQPEVPISYSSRAAARFQIGAFDKAFEDYKSAIRRNPDDHELISEFHVAYERLIDREGKADFGRTVPGGTDRREHQGSPLRNACELRHSILQDQAGNEAVVKDVRECFGYYNRTTEQTSKACMSVARATSVAKKLKRGTTYLIGSRVFTILYKGQVFYILEEATPGAPWLHYFVETEFATVASSSKWPQSRDRETLHEEKGRGKNRVLFDFFRGDDIFSVARDSGPLYGEIFTFQSCTRSAR